MQKELSFSKNWQVLKSSRKIKLTGNKIKKWTVDRFLFQGALVCLIKSIKINRSIIMLYLNKWRSQVKMTMEIRLWMKIQDAIRFLSQTSKAITFRKMERSISNSSVKTANKKLRGPSHQVQACAWEIMTLNKALKNHCWGKPRRGKSAWISSHQDQTAGWLPNSAYVEIQCGKIKRHVISVKVRAQSILRVRS